MVGKKAAIVKNYKAYSKGGKSQAVARVNYAVHRPEDGKAEREHREVFGAEGELSKTAALDRMDDFHGAATERGRETYTVHLVLNPGEGKTDVDLEQYTREVMGRVADDRADKGAQMTWAAVTHRQQSEHDHVHVYITTDKVFDKTDLKRMHSHTEPAWEAGREKAAQDRELYRGQRDDRTDDQQTQRGAAGGGRMQTQRDEDERGR